MYQGNNLVAALDSFDKVLTQYPLPSKPHLNETLAYTLTCKSFLLYEIGETIDADEFSLLLKCLAENGSLTLGSVDALIAFIASVEPTKALNLLEASPSAHLLLPLITALQQEVGQTPQVAKEVAEVASDVRARLTTARARNTQIRAQDNAP